MSTAAASALVKTGRGRRNRPEPPQFIEQEGPPGLVQPEGAEAPWLSQVYISGADGLGVHGLLKSISRGGLQALTSIPVPVRTQVLITISGCCTVPAEVFYCVKKTTAYQVGIVFSTRHKPEVVVGAFASIRNLEDPSLTTRGHIMDVASSSLSILCKTALRPGAWVRVESNGWIMFGEVEGVVPSSMVASCVGIHLDAAFRAQFAGPGGPAPVLSETATFEYEGANNGD
jgi:hypothetical protein